MNCDPKYTADRWLANDSALGGIKVDKSDTGLKISWLIACTGTLFYNMEEKATIIGKVITVSIKVDGVIYSYTTTVTSINNYIRFDLSTKSFSIYSGSSTTQAILMLYHSAAPIGTTYTINYCKLEGGSIATPFVPRLYGEELALCMRYYEVVRYSSRAMTNKVTNIAWEFDTVFKVSKRQTPTCSLINVWIDGSLSSAFPITVGAQGTDIFIAYNSVQTLNAGQRVEYSGYADAEIY